MTDQGAEGLLSPFLRAKRIQAVRPYLYGNILDFGCGSGSLAAYIDQDKYLGFDLDENVLKVAKQNFIKHRFESDINALRAKYFDTIAILAVIEHVEDPIEFLSFMKSLLTHTSESKIVCTTPHPSMDCLHGFGASIGLFSKHANEEHKELLNYQSLKDIGNKIGLEISYYRRFLLGANQLFIFKPKKDSTNDTGDK